jgi:hypothetical protein
MACTFDAQQNMDNSAPGLYQDRAFVKVLGAAQLTMEI